MMFSSIRKTEQHLPLVVSVVTTAFTVSLTGYAAFVSNSVTLRADFYKCFVEFIAIVLSFVLIKRARSADLAHFNYGTGKLEQLCSSFVAVALFCSGLLCLWSGSLRGLHPEPVVDAHFGFVLSLLSVLGNGIMWRWFRTLHRSDPSPVADSQAQLFLSKLLASLTVCISLTCSFFTGSLGSLVYSDALGSFALGIFLLSSARSLAGEAVNDLVDRSLEESFQLLVLKVLIAHESEYRGFLGIRSRRSGRTRIIEIHVAFEEQTPMSAVQEFSDSVRVELEGHILNSDVLIVPSVYGAQTDAA